MGVQPGRNRIVLIVVILFLVAIAVVTRNQRSGDSRSTVAKGESKSEATQTLVVTPQPTTVATEPPAQVPMAPVAIATKPPAPVPSPTAKELPSTITATSSQPFINSISMKFVPLDEQPGKPLLLICITPTLLQHYAEYCDEVKGGDQTWRRSVGGSLGSVTYVNWHDANDFCDWLTRRERQRGNIDKKGSYRLPSGAEWNRALNVSSTLGLAEMTGGVWQWCLDSIGNHERVLRGGNRTNGDIHGNDAANLRRVSYGFRVVLQIPTD